MAYRWSAQQFKILAIGSMFILIIMLQSGNQMNLSVNRRSTDPHPQGISAQLQQEEHILKKRSLPQTENLDGATSSDNTLNLEPESVYPIDIDNDKLLTATLLKPLMTSTPFPTLTTERQKSVLPPLATFTQPGIVLGGIPSKNYPHITDWSDVPEHLFIKQYYAGNFSYPNQDLCSRKKNLTLLILITSAIDNFQHRNNVRLTWGHYGQRGDVQFAFVIGDSLFSQFNESVKTALAQEVELYQDFIIGSFPDTYRGLSLKTLHMLDWASTHCNNARYLLKTDDDIFLNVPGILGFIEKIQDGDEQQPKIYGHVFSGHHPKRDESHKHHLKYDIYPHNVTYPNFTSGPAYLMSLGIVRPLFYEALKLPFIPLEDVLVNGFAASTLQIPRVDVPGFLNEIKNPVELSACELNSILAGMTDGSPIQMSFVWYNYLMGRAICLWKYTNDTTDRVMVK